MKQLWNSFIQLCEQIGYTRAAIWFARHGETQKSLDIVKK